MKIEELYKKETGFEAITNRHYIEWLESKLSTLSEVTEGGSAEYLKNAAKLNLTSQSKQQEQHPVVTDEKILINAIEKMMRKRHDSWIRDFMVGRKKEDVGSVPYFSEASSLKFIKDMLTELSQPSEKKDLSDTSDEEIIIYTNEREHKIKMKFIHRWQIYRLYNPNGIDDTKYDILLNTSPNWYDTKHVQLGGIVEVINGMRFIICPKASTSSRG